ncbi:MAG: DUF481 domain-containing protein [Gemmatimonadaceae bacterium]
MLTHRITQLSLAAAVFAAPLALRAQDPPKPKPQEFTADLGFVSTSGNSKVTTLNIGEKLIVRRAKWEHKQQFGAVYGAEDGKQTSNLLFANIRTDYALSKSITAFGYVGYDRNTFAGIARRFEEAAGLAVKIINSDRDQWNAEVGLALNQQLSTTDSTLNFTSLRSGTSYKHFFSKTAYAFQGLEYLPSFKDSQDYRINSETSIVAPLSAHMSMKAGYIIRFDNVPEPAHVKSDRIFTTGLQFNW